MPKGQTDAARAERLSQCCCPVHGLGMGQLDGWYHPLDGTPDYTVVGCPRRDCDVRAKATSYDGPAELIPADWSPPDPSQSEYSMGQLAADERRILRRLAVAARAYLTENERAPANRDQARVDAAASDLMTALGQVPQYVWIEEADSR
jgi:hypothetical protein